MKWILTPYAIALLISSTFAAAVFIILYQRRREKSTFYLSLAMLSIMIWAFNAGLEAAAVQIEDKIFWSKIAAVGVCTTPVFILLFSMEYAHLDRWLTRWNILFLFIVPISSILLTMTNQYHHAIWSAVVPYPDPVLNVAYYEKGTWYWVHWAYLNVAMFMATLILIQVVWRYKSIYRKQAMIILMSSTPPWIVNLIYVFNPKLVQAMDFTPLGFFLAVILFSWGVNRFRLFDMLPMVREVFFEKVREGVILIDDLNRIVDINQAGEAMLGTAARKLIGQPIEIFFRGLPALVERLDQIVDQVFEIQLPENPDKYLEIQITVLASKDNRPDGMIVSLQDITPRRQAEEQLRLSEARYQAIVEEQMDLICRWLPDNTLSFVNRAYCDYFNISRTQALENGETGRDIPEMRTLTDQAIQLLFTGKETMISQEEWNFDWEGNLRWVIWEYCAIQDAQGKVIEVQGAGRDITDRIRAEDAEREQRLLAESLSEIAKALNSTLDIDRVLDLILSSLEEVVPYESADLMLIHAGYAYIQRWHRTPSRENREFLTGFRLRIEDTPNLAEMRLSGEPLVIPDIDLYPGWVMLPNTEWIRSYVGAPLKLGSEVIGFIVLTSSVTGFFHQIHAERLKAYAEQATVALHNARLYSQVQQKIEELSKAEAEISKAKEIAEKQNLKLQEALAELELAATTDKLTGAYNRRKFDEMILFEINRARRYSLNFGLIMMDVDHFKNINDRYGHSLGDQILVGLGKVIMDNLRATDTLTRWGGEEFIILAPELDLPQTAALAEKVRSQVSEHEFMTVKHITLSLGVTSYQANDTMDSIIKRADKALYKAKRAGRNQVVTSAMSGLVVASSV